MLSHPATLAAFGIIVGFVGSLVGVGGGFLMVPYFTIGLLFSKEQAVGTSLGVIVANAGSALLGYARQRRIDWRVGAVLGLSALPGTLFGQRTNFKMDAVAFDFTFAGLVAIAGVLTVAFRAEDRPGLAWFRRGARRRLVDATGTTFEYDMNLWVAAAASVAVGFVSSLFGVGGGFLHVPMLILLYGVPVHIAMPTSALALAITTAGGVVQYALAQRVDLQTLLYVGLGAFLGAQAGVLVAPRLSGRALRWALAGLLAVAAGTMIWRGLTPAQSRI